MLPWLIKSNSQPKISPKNGIFDLIEHDLFFENASTNKLKMNHIKTMLCGNFVGIDKLERLKLLQNDPLINEFNI